MTTSLARRWATAGLVLAGALFVVYPALRPYSSETGLDGARAFASWPWTAAHLAGMASFVLLARLAGRLSPRPEAGRLATPAISLGATLVLPYYGAEVFGVGAVGRWALADDTAGRLGQVGPLVETIRFGVPALVLFAAGLLLLAVGGIAAGVALWHDRARPAAVLLAVGLAAYLPQFFLPPGLRIAHGVVLGLGLVLAAVHDPRPATPGTMLR